MIFYGTIGSLHATYDTESGEFISKSNRRFGKKLGWINDSGYVVISVGNGVAHRAHRLAWYFVHGHLPANDIDHINGVRTDNRLSNLREATRAENMQNTKTHHRDNKAKLAGVSCVKGKYWFSRICHHGVISHLGSFDSPEKAHQAYLDAKKRLHPFYAK
jgi:hypothetical protein